MRNMHSRTQTQTGRKLVEHRPPPRPTVQCFAVTFKSKWTGYNQQQWKSVLFSVKYFFKKEKNIYSHSDPLKLIHTVSSKCIGSWFVLVSVSQSRIWFLQQKCTSCMSQHDVKHISVWHRFNSKQMVKRVIKVMLADVVLVDDVWRFLVSDCFTSLHGISR